MGTQKKTEIITTNKKAHFNYDIKTKYLAGILITGTEIKSIREKSCSLNESFCYIKDNEIFIKNMYVKKYEYGSLNNHEENRDRKLLLTKQEINKISKKVNEKGFSLIPIKVLIVKGWAKVEVGVGKGKKIYDKKEKVKNKDIKRDVDREMKSK